MNTQKPLETLSKKGIELNQLLNSISIQSRRDRNLLINLEYDLKLTLKRIGEVLDG